MNGQTLYFRRYPTRGLAAHVVGYSTQVRSRAGLERSMNDFLTGSNANLSTVVDTEVDKLFGRHVVGNDLVLTLDARAQRVAMQALGRKLRVGRRDRAVDREGAGDGELARPTIRT